MAACGTLFCWIFLRAKESGPNWFLELFRQRLNLSEELGTMSTMLSEEACFLRETTGTSAVAETARTVAAVLAEK
jgi:hypothetical protein